MMSGLAQGTYYVKPTAWRAFVYPRQPDSPPQLMLSDGTVTTPDQRCQAGEDGQDALGAQVEPISQEDQKGWAREFLADRGLAESDAAVELDAPSWWSRFAQWLQKRGGEGLKLEWDRRRTERVVEYLNRWSSRHGIDPGVLYSREEEIARPAPTPKKKAVSGLRDDIWRAFTYVTPQPVLCFLDRLSGQLSSQVESTDAGHWAQLIPISQEEQRGWARDFTGRHLPDAVAECDAILASASWWADFPKWLAERNKQLVPLWKSDKTDRGIRYIQAWATEHGVPREYLFEAETSSKKSTRMPSSVESKEDARQAILAAIHEMTLDELDALSIPVRYLRRHFRVR